MGLERYLGSNRSVTEVLGKAIDEIVGKYYISQGNVVHVFIMVMNPKNQYGLEEATNYVLREMDASLSSELYMIPRESEMDDFTSHMGILNLFFVDNYESFR